jgi:hypothetical protein
MNNLKYKTIELTSDETEFIKKALHRLVGESKLSLNIISDMSDSKKIEIMTDIIKAGELIDEIDSCEYKTLDTSSV